jgi:DNA-binding LytR/AlgR family response regulator
VKPVNKYRWWIGAAVPLSVVLGTVIGTPHTFADAILYMKIALNLFLGAVVWGFLFAASRQFDRLMPWESVRHSRRWLLQLLVTLPVVSAIVWVLVSIRNDFLDTPSSLHLFFYTDVPVISLLAFGIQLLFQRMQLSKMPQQVAEAPPPPATIAVKNLGKTHLIPTSDIAYIYRLDNVNYLRRFDGQDVLSDQSIKTYEETLGEQAFFRVNRKLLVSRQAIVSFKATADRKTLLELTPPWKEAAVLDKNRLSIFKKWLQQP